MARTYLIEPSKRVQSGFDPVQNTEFDYFSRFTYISNTRFHTQYIEFRSNVIHLLLPCSYRT